LFSLLCFTTHQGTPVVLPAWWYHLHCCALTPSCCAHETNRSVAKILTHALSDKSTRTPNQPRKKTCPVAKGQPKEPGSIDDETFLYIHIVMSTTHYALTGLPPPTLCPCRPVTAVDLPPQSPYARMQCSGSTVVPAFPRMQRCHAFISPCVCRHRVLWTCMESTRGSGRCREETRRRLVCCTQGEKLAAVQSGFGPPVRRWHILRVGGPVRSWRHFRA
jgi:hypothetical protein